MFSTLPESREIELVFDGLGFLRRDGKLAKVIGDMGVIVCDKNGHLPGSWGDECIVRFWEAWDDFRPPTLLPQCIVACTAAVANVVSSWEVENDVLTSIEVLMATVHSRR